MANRRERGAKSKARYFFFMFFSALSNAQSLPTERVFLQNQSFEPVFLSLYDFLSWIARSLLWAQSKVLPLLRVAAEYL